MPEPQTAQQRAAEQYLRRQQARTAATNTFIVAWLVFMVVVGVAAEKSDWKPFTAPPTKTTETVQTGAVNKSVTVTETGGNVARVIRGGGAVIGTLVAVSIAAFIVAALVQRAVEGRFDVKVGALGLDAAVREADSGFDAVLEQVAELSDQVKRNLKAISGYHEAVETGLAVKDADVVNAEFAALAADEATTADGGGAGVD